MAFNPNELIIDRVRYVVAHDLETKEKLFMLKEIEEPSLNTTAEGEDVVDAVGALITTLYRSKQAEFTASNSLFSLDLAAQQFGAKKEIATADGMIAVNTYEILKVEDGATTVTLTKTPVAGSVQYIYSVVNGTASTSYKAGAAASETEFVINEETGEITLPAVDGTPVVSGEIFVEYQYETENAVRIINSASEFPEVCEAVIYCIFRDVCTEKLIAGQIICHKAKLDPSSVEIGLTATGKHPFTFKMFKDYCSTDDKLFTIVVSE